MKRAFSLVELIVVIGIIGILSGILIASFGSGTEAARAAKCLSNMRSLAQAAISRASATDTGAGLYRCYPAAGSHSLMCADDGGGIAYVEEVGWLSWLCKNDEYGMRSSRNKHPLSFVSLGNACAYSTDTDNPDARFAITNGAVWRAVDGNREIYVCPDHARDARKKGVVVNWSYVMSAYMGYDWSNGSKAVGIVGKRDNRVSLNSTRLERTLLFAELPFNDHEFGGAKIDTQFNTSPDTSNDGILQYKGGTIDGKSYNNNWSGRAETIAFNHKSGKRWCAHVAFADGHTEKLMLPKDGGGLSKQQLTALLCGDDARGGGKDVGYGKNGYELLKN